MQLVNRVPAADVIPTDLITCQTHNVIGALEHRVINRDVFAQRERFAEFLIELAVAERRQSGKNTGGLRQVAAQGVDHDAGAPEKHSGVPVESLRGQVFYGGFEVRLLAKARDRRRYQRTGLRPA